MALWDILHDLEYSHFPVNGKQFAAFCDPCFTEQKICDFRPLAVQKQAAPTNVACRLFCRPILLGRCRFIVFSNYCFIGTWQSGSVSRADSRYVLWFPPNQMPEPPQLLISDDVRQVQSAGEEDHKAQNSRPGRHQTGGIQTPRTA